MRRFWCTVCSTWVRRHAIPLVRWTDSFLCQTLVVDSALEIVDTYHRKIIDLEHQILLRPKMTTVRQREAPVSLGGGVPDLLARLISDPPSFT